jgi:small subunit ribosomal protein S8
MLTVIRNGARAKHEKVDIPNSKILVAIADILKKEGYIDNYRIIKDVKVQGILRVYLRYVNKKSVIINLKRVSRPGLRIYSDAKSIPKVLRGKGMAILTTSKGLMTDDEARESKMGGEVLCYVW